MRILRVRLQKAALAALFFSAAAIVASDLSAQPLNIHVENFQPAAGFWYTPVWVGFHEGGFDIDTSGDPAANFPGLEEIAEGGATGPLSADFHSIAGRWDTTILAPAGFADAPVFDPGDIVNETVTFSDPASKRYFSYASMVIPSNDAFFCQWRSACPHGLRRGWQFCRADYDRDSRPRHPRCRNRGQ